MSITAGAMLGLTALSGLNSAVNNSINNVFNAQQAQINRDWQERMSNTAYQRAVADMKKAGLNPMLAYSQGGSSVGSGANATASTPMSLAFPNSALESKEFKKLALDSHSLQNDIMREQVYGKRLENRILEENLSQKNNSRFGFR